MDCIYKTGGVYDVLNIVDLAKYFQLFAFGIMSENTKTHSLALSKMTTLKPSILVYLSFVFVVFD